MVVDANVWISAARQNETRYPASIAWLRTQIRSHAVIEIPTLALAEVGGAMARISGSPGAGRLSVRDLLAIPDLRLIDMDRRLTYEASLLATRLRLRGADAIYVAVARRLRVPLVTWDQELTQRASPVIQVFHP